ncbi:MAG: hypothetical protein JWM09_1317, partial [Francisellaceae bacterium]|nr:hypothetical protein [Francisellaceae bacterium]
MNNNNIIVYAGVDLSIANGPTLHVLGIAKGFVENGYNVIVLAPKCKLKKNIPLNRPGITFEFHTNFFIGNYIHFMGAIFCVSKLVILLSKYKPLFLYSRMSALSFIPLIVAKKLRYFVISEHNGLLADEIKSLYPKLTLLCKLFNFLQLLDIYFSNKIRVVTNLMKERLLKYNLAKNKAEHIVVIGNGTDVELFFPRDRVKCLKFFNLNPSFRYVGFIGTLVVWQGLTVALKALQSTLEYHSDLYFIIAGEGPELNKLKSLTHDLNISKKVIFLGQVNYEMAPIVINCFDIAISPATYVRNNISGVSTLKIRDYAACGKTILASRLPGNEML